MLDLIQLALNYMIYEIFDFYDGLSKHIFVQNIIRYLGRIWGYLLDFLVLKPICFIRSYKVLQGTAKYYKVLQGTTRSYKILQSTTRYYKVLQGTTKYFKVLQDTTRYYKVL